MEININEAVEMFNNGMSLKEVGERFGVSKSTIQRRISGSGYIYDKETKMYCCNLDNNDSCKINNNSVHETIEDVSCETIDNKNNKKEKFVSRTYTIPDSIDKAVKIKAVLENKQDYEVVREALRSYIEDKYFNIR